MTPESLRALLNRSLALLAQTEHTRHEPDCCVACGLSLDLHFTAARSAMYIGCAGARFVKEWLVGHGYGFLVSELK
jgi:hypothetical protein